MPERATPGPVTSENRIREAVCINTMKIYDACREQDGAGCIFLLFESAQDT